MSSSELISIKELASKLKVTDALLKKLIKDFDIVTERVQKRVYLSESSVTTVREVLALRASGKKNKEIKELFEESMAIQAAQDTASAEIETIVDEVTPVAETAAAKQPKADLRKAKPVPMPRKAKAKKPNETATDDKTEESVINTPEEAITAVAEEPEEVEEHAVDLSSYLEEDQAAEDEPSMAMRLAEESDVLDEAESAEVEELDFEEDPEEEKEVAVVEEPERHTERARQDRLSPRKMRRRQFSFSYIQRQIANDSKRIHYIQQKLKRGSLSTREEMNLKDSLEHRSKLLSGWVHLLRWVKS